MTNTVCLDTYNDIGSIYKATKKKKPILIYTKSGLNIHSPDFGYIHSFNNKVIIIHSPSDNKILMNIIRIDHIRMFMIDYREDILKLNYNLKNYIHQIFLLQNNKLDCVPIEIKDHILGFTDIIYEHPQISLNPNHNYIDLFAQIKKSGYNFIIDFNDRKLACNMFNYTLKWRPIEILILKNFYFDENHLIINSYTINDNHTPIINGNYYILYNNIISIKINKIKINNTDKLSKLN